MKKQEIIAQARQGFDGKLHTDEYRKIHSDQAHLEALMGFLDIQPGKHYLDLGTGNGYLAFEMARRFPEIFITGVDIATNSIRADQQLQQERNIKNLEFMEYDGGRLPVGDSAYWGIISRYAFHHFPDPAASVCDLYRIMEPCAAPCGQGFVIFSDPITYDDDTGNFIDHFQQLKKDGHVHFYRQGELDDLFQQNGFRKQKQFFTKITYPRDMNKAYQRLFERTPASILKEYEINIGESSVQITVTVRNVMYRKV